MQHCTPRYSQQGRSRNFVGTADWSRSVRVDGRWWGTWVATSRIQAVQVQGSSGHQNDKPRSPWVPESSQAVGWVRRIGLSLRPGQFKSGFFLPFWPTLATNTQSAVALKGPPPGGSNTPKMAKNVARSSIRLPSLGPQCTIKGSMSPAQDSTKEPKGAKGAIGRRNSGAGARVGPFCGVERTESGGLPPGRERPRNRKRSHGAPDIFGRWVPHRLPHDSAPR